MGTKLQTLVDSLSIVDGVWQERASNIGLFEQAAMIPSRHGRGNLYILVETVGGFPDHAQIQQRIIEVVQQYFATDGSITAGLREAIKAANESLFELNLNAPREQRGVAGVTCLVLKDQDAYTGQIGPALLYQIGRDRFQRLPQESTWLSSEKLQDVDISKNPPLGLRRTVEPDLCHLHVRDGDVFILATTSLDKLTTEDQIRNAVIHRGAHTVRENLEAMVSGKDLSLLIVEVLSVEQAPVPAEKPGGRPRVEERPKARPGIFSALRRLFPAAREQPEGLAEEELPYAEEEEGPPYSPGFDLKVALQSVWRGVSRFLRSLIPMLARILPEAETGQRPTQGRRGEALGRGLKPPARLGREPPKAGRPARRGEQTRAAGVERQWLWLVLAIPVLIILLFAITRFQYNRSRQAQFNRFIQTARDAKAAAEASPSIAEQRIKLREALVSFDAALQVKPDDKELLDERQAAQDLLDSKNYVSRLFYFGELTELPDTANAKSQISAIVVHGIDLYVLDVGTDRVYKYLLNQTKDSLQELRGEPVLLRKGDQRGDIVVDELVDIAWAEPSAGSAAGALLILDQKGHLLRYDPMTEIKVLPIAGAGSWRGPVAMATYFTNLYVLDPPANAVLKYAPTAAGYDAPPSNYFKAEANANVSNGIDMSIDGSIYVLHADGQVTKYFQGASSPFPQTNLDEPLKAPCCIFVSGQADESGYVYVADAGNQRIVKYSKDGEFKRQYRSREPELMSALRGLYVDEAERKAYLANGNKLYWVTLPE